MKNSLFVASLTTIVAVGTLSLPITAFGGVCDVSFDNMFGAFSGAINPPNPNWGMRDTYQYSYFLGTEGLEMLKKQESCMSAADFAANYQALKGMRDQGREGCIKTSSDGGASCKPRYPK